MVTNEQLWIMIGIPMLSNAVLTGLGIAFLKRRFDASDRRWDRMLHAWRKADRRTPAGLQ